MASTDEIYLTVKGKGGHAAMKGTYVNPLLIAAEILLTLEKELSNSPLEGGAPRAGNVSSRGIPTVLAFGRMHANGATNVIPDEVYMEGTFRTFDETWRSAAHERMKTMAEKIAEGIGGKCDFRIERGYPVLKNDSALTAKLRSGAEEYMGKENVTDLDMWMAAEDFSYYSHEIPACFYRLGVRNEKKGITSPVHTATFNIDEDALATGMGLMAWLAIGELKSS